MCELDLHSGRYRPAHRCHAWTCDMLGNHLAHEFSVWADISLSSAKEDVTVESGRRGPRIDDH
jgi:hypothetical protein